MVHYGLRCASCRTENFRGLKYKSDRAPNYQLCQACFWCGHISSEHKNDVFKEYNTFKPTSGRSTTPLSTSSLKKSINCLQGGGGSGGSTGSKKSSSKKVPKFPEHPDKPMDLSNQTSGGSWNSQPNFPIPPVRSGSAASNPISDLHYFGEYDDPYMVRCFFDLYIKVGHG